MARDLVKLGKFISLVLRHSPETIDLKLDLPKLEKYVGFMSGKESGLVTLRIS